MSRLEYLLYRCFKCGSLLTALEVEDAWANAEKDVSKTVAAICPCGSSKITPSNMTPEEEKKYSSWKQRIRYFLGFRDANTRIVELYFNRVKGKDLGPGYEGVE